MSQQFVSIRTKLMQAILLTSGIVLMLTYASYFVFEIVSYKEITTAQLKTLSNIIAYNSSAALAFESQEEAEDILSSLKAEKKIINATLYNSSGNLFHFYSSINPPKSLPGLNEKEGLSFRDKYITVVTPVIVSNKQIGTLVIRRSIDDMYDRLMLYSLIAITIITLCFLLAYLLSQRLQNKLSTPIVELSEIATRISVKHDYSLRAKVESNDEIGLLTESFNNMVGKIQVQNQELEDARHAAQQHALVLEEKVKERTIEIKRQKDFAEVVVNSSLVLIAVFDREFKIMAFNDLCEKEFGMRKEDVIGRRFEEAMPKIKDSLTYRNLQRAMEGEVIHTPKYVSAVTGLYYESSMVPLRNEHNEIYAVLMTAHNITDFVTASEQLSAANQELQQKNSELEQFAYVASHDLQEPLRKIQTFIQLLKMNINNPEQSERYMAKIENSAARMASLIKDVLEYSRLSKEQDPSQAVDLNDILSNVKSDFELIISQKNAQINADLLPIVSGHKLQMHQLITNLLSNALKFNNDKPVVTIEARIVSKEEVVSLNLAAHGEYTMLTFSDNGIGFEQQYADKIFTIFQRLNTREKFEGTGIGLALCKKIVENHNGHIRVQSEVGKGTTFFIALPLYNPLRQNERFARFEVTLK